MKTTVWVKLEIETEHDAHDIVDAALDGGDLQDCINTRTPAKVVSATVEDPAKPSPKMRRALSALIASVETLLVSEGSVAERAFKRTLPAARRALSEGAE